MRQETRTIYKFGELSEDIQRKIVKRRIERNQTDSDLPWQREIFDSLKTLFKHCDGATLRHYDLGLCNRSNGIKVEFGGYYSDEIGALTGARALGWLENNLFCNLRMTRAQYLAKRRDYFKYGSAYRIGKIKPCPLTGYCADDDYLDDLRKAVIDGRTLKEAFEDLADTYVRLLESEYDYYTSEECARESIECDGAEYDERGNEI